MFAARNMMFAGVSAAGAYISAVETALGSSITSTQKAALNAFVLAEQAAARWTSHKRLYLPIWANAAANAICLKSLTSGTFAGTVTHGAGYVQSDGSTGYFDFGISPPAMGLTTASANITVLIKQASVQSGTRAHMSVSNDGANTTYFGFSSSGGAHFRYTNCNITNSNGYVEHLTTLANQVGIWTGGRDGGIRYIQRRQLAGLTDLAAQTEPDTGSMPPLALIAMAFNYNGTPTAHCSAQYGAWTASSGLSQADNAAFTGNLKTLWETCTGLSLP
jgi:hypothetical protein